MKEIYLAGRLDGGESTLQELAVELETRGHRVIEKWFLAGRLPKPYLTHPETSTPAAAAMIKAAFESDVAILFPTDDILGAMGEFGAALGSTMVNPDKIVVVINPYQVRQSVFYAHPGVLALHNVAELRLLEWF